MRPGASRESKYRNIVDSSLRTRVRRQPCGRSIRPGRAERPEASNSVFLLLTTTV